MNRENFSIRKGAAADIPAVFDLIYELAVYEKAAHEVTNTPEQLLLDGFGSNPNFGLFVAEYSTGKIVGMALYYVKYSTWKGKCVFLEDIIVTESCRGKGLGAMLFESVIQVAKEILAGRLEWQVLNWNEPAIGFYKKYGSIMDEEWINGKLTFDQIQSFENRKS